MDDSRCCFSNQVTHSSVACSTDSTVSLQKNAIVAFLRA